MGGAGMLWVKGSKIHFIRILCLLLTATVTNNGPIIWASSEETSTAAAPFQLLLVLPVRRRKG